MRTKLAIALCVMLAPAVAKASPDTRFQAEMVGMVMELAEMKVMLADLQKQPVDPKDLQLIAQEEAKLRAMRASLVTDRPHELKVAIGSTALVAGLGVATYFGGGVITGAAMGVPAGLAIADFINFHSDGKEIAQLDKELSDADQLLQKYGAGANDGRTAGTTASAPTTSAPSATASRGTGGGVTR